MRRAVFVATAPIVLFGVLAAQSSGDALVTVEGGALRGVVRDGVTAYLGIPYAAPPVGNLRWSEDCLFLNVWMPSDAAGRRRASALAGDGRALV